MIICNYVYPCIPLQVLVPMLVVFTVELKVNTAAV